MNINIVNFARYNICRELEKFASLVEISRFEAIIKFLYIEFSEFLNEY